VSGAQRSVAAENIREAHVTYLLNSSNVVCDTIDGEVLAIRSDNGAYYSMQGPSATAWAAIVSGAALDDAAEMVAAHHGADTGTVRADLDAFAEQLSTELLVVAAPSESAVIELPAETLGVPWETPMFEKYTDMQDLLLFDPIHEVDVTGWPSVKANRPA
jgi:3-oxoacyl-ACP reductase-like protein